MLIDTVPHGTLMQSEQYTKPGVGCIAPGRYKLYVCALEYAFTRGLLLVAQLH